MAAESSRPSPQSQPTAHVNLRNIQLTAPLGPDPWHRPNKPQPLTASIRISHPDAAISSAERDEVGKTLDYGKLYKRIEKVVDDTEAPEEYHDPEGWRDVRSLGWKIATTGLTELNALKMSELGSGRVETVEVWLEFPNAVLLADKGLKYYCRKELEWESGRCKAATIVDEEIRIEGVGCACVIGVNPHERLERQRVVVGISFRWDGEKEEWGRKVVPRYQEVTRVVFEKVNATSYKTVEALASYVAEIVTMDFDLDRVTVTVEKPSALAFVERAGAEITRTREFYEDKKKATQ